MFDQFGMLSLPGSVVGAANRVRSRRSVGSTVPTIFSRPETEVQGQPVYGPGVLHESSDVPVEEGIVDVRIGAAYLVRHARSIPLPQGAVPLLGQPERRPLVKKPTFTLCDPVTYDIETLVLNRST